MLCSLLSDPTDWALGVWCFFRLQDGPVLYGVSDVFEIAHVSDRSDVISRSK